MAIQGYGINYPNAKLRFFIYALLVIILGGAGLYIQSTRYVDADPNLATGGYVAQPNGFLQTPQAVLNNLLSNGFITGKVMYPGNPQLPDNLSVCAQTTNASKKYCIKNFDVPDSKGYAAFTIKVPQGVYYVYSQIDGQTYQAFYDNYVVCGLRAGCDFLPITPVVVQRGKTTDKVFPIDWYQSSGGQPAQ